MEKGKRFSEEIVEVVKDFRIIDDVFFRVFGRDKGACQEMLRTLLDEPSLKVLSTKTQEGMGGFKRGIVLDALCEVEGGRHINIEVQKTNQNDDIRRNRLYLSIITANKTEKGTEFKDVPEVAVVYISEYDALKNNQTVTLCEMCQLVDGVYKPLNDGAKVYYANTKVKDNSKKSKLLSLFLEREPFDSEDFPKISNTFRNLKENKKEEFTMCLSVEKIAKEERLEEKIEIAKKLIAKGFSDEEITEITSLPFEEISELRESI